MKADDMNFEARIGGINGAFVVMLRRLQRDRNETDMNELFTLRDAIPRENDIVRLYAPRSISLDHLKATHNAISSEMLPFISNLKSAKEDEAYEIREILNVCHDTKADILEQIIAYYPEQRSDPKIREAVIGTLPAFNLYRKIVESTPEISDKITKEFPDYFRDDLKDRLPQIVKEVFGREPKMTKAVLIYTLRFEFTPPILNVNYGEFIDFHEAMKRYFNMDIGKRQIYSKYNEYFTDHQTEKVNYCKEKINYILQTIDK